MAGGTLADAGSFPAGDGARHIDFDPTGHHAYVVNENASTVSVFSFDTTSGALTSIQPAVSTLPPGFAGQNTGAEIQVTPDGKHVLASNRGDDSIAVFTIDSTKGTLTRTGRTPTGGKTPRHFQIDRTGRFLFVGNQGSGTVVVMTLDATTGVPTAVGTPLSVAGPEYTGLVYLN
jgi:6-phosphogluconolactonase